MNLKYLIWTGFVVMVIAQWWVNLHMIREREGVITSGTTYKFEVAPVDPEDPFRGRYITLNIREDSWTGPGMLPFEVGQTVFVTYSTDQRGFAKIEAVSLEKPGDDAFVRARVRSFSERRDSSTIFFEYPFERYFMEESKAPQAEELYQQRLSDPANKTYALVSVFRGDAVLLDVLVNDTSISKLVNKP